MTAATDLSPASAPTAVEAGRDPSQATIGAVLVVLAVLSASFGLGMSSSPYSATLSATMAGILVAGLIFLVGSSFVLARGLGYRESRSDPVSRTLAGGSRRGASPPSRLGEVGSWLLILGAELLAVAFLSALPVFQGTVCLQGPCSSDVPGYVVQSLYLGGAVLVSIGLLVLVLRSTRRRSLESHRSRPEAGAH